MTGIYKNIKVKVWENEKDPKKYTIELFDYDDESVTLKELEATGFVEYFNHWYTTVSKEDVKLISI